MTPRRREQSKVLNKAHVRLVVLWGKQLYRASVAAAAVAISSETDNLPLLPFPSSTELAIPVELGQLLFLDAHVIQTTLITGCPRRAHRIVRVPACFGFKEHHSMAELCPRPV